MMALTMLLATAAASSQELSVYTPRPVQYGEYVEMTQEFPIYEIRKDAGNHWQKTGEGRCTMTISNLSNLRIEWYVTPEGIVRKPEYTEYCLLGDEKKDVYVLVDTKEKRMYVIDMSL